MENYDRICSEVSPPDGLRQIPEGQTKKKGRWLSVTSVVSLYTATAAALIYTLRNCLSIAIIPMKDEFSWDDYSQGIILSSFYYGYVVTGIAGGWASDYFGAKWVLGLSVVLSSLLSLATPLAARCSMWLLVSLRIFEGMVQGVFFPALNCLVGAWSTLQNRAQVSMVMHSGISLGMAFNFAVSGWLAYSTFLGGWPSVFYVMGFIGLTFGVIYLWVVVNDPRHHPNISDRELEQLLRGCLKYADDNIRENKVPVPWRSILRSSQFWIATLAATGSDFCFYFVATEIPTYMDQMLNYSLLQNGLLTSLIYVATFAFTIAYGFLLTKAIENERITVLNSRKLSMGLGSYVPMAGFVLLCIFGTHPIVAVVILVVSECVISAAYGGANCTMSDISPRFCGSLNGISNTCGAVSGFIAPLMTGTILNNNETFSAWRKVFAIVALSCFVSVTPYVLFITDCAQSWDKPCVGKRSERETGGPMKSESRSETALRAVAEEAAYFAGKEVDY